MVVFRWRRIAFHHCLFPGLEKTRSGMVQLRWIFPRILYHSSLHLHTLAKNGHFGQNASPPFLVGIGACHLFLVALPVCPPCRDSDRCLFFHGLAASGSGHLFLWLSDVEGTPFSLVPTPVHDSHSGADIFFSHHTLAAFCYQRKRVDRCPIGYTGLSWRQCHPSSGSRTMQVVQACSGLRSMISLLTLSAIFGYFTLKSNFLRMILFFSGIPAAIVVNVIRVLLLVTAFYYLNFDLASGPIHTLFGMTIFILALLLIITMKRVLSIWDRSTA